MSSKKNHVMDLYYAESFVAVMALQARECREHLFHYAEFVSLFKLAAKDDKLRAELAAVDRMNEFRELTAASMLCLRKTLLETLPEKLEACRESQAEMTRCCGNVDLNEAIGPAVPGSEFVPADLGPDDREALDRVVADDLQKGACLKCIYDYWQCVAPDSRYLRDTETLESVQQLYVLTSQFNARAKLRQRYSQ
jgi:hypothetical protein